MPHFYTEDQLCEQPAIQLFATLGWATISAMEEVFGPSGTLGRETKGEVALGRPLRTALERLNPGLPTEAITTAIDDLTRNRSAMILTAANREVYTLLKEGIPVSVPDRERGGQKTERVRMIDWENPESNDFLLVSQMTITGPLYTCRPDLIGFVNGLPWIVIELKKPGIPARQAFDDNLTSYKDPQNGIPALFWFNALLIASNGTDSRIGSLTADWERFFEWKRIEREDEPRRVSLEVMIRGTCAPPRLLDLVENFTLFSEQKAGLVKVLAQNHQLLGVNNAIAATLAARKQGHGRGGVFWQTQGSGKSLSMVFFSQKILRKVPGNWTFVVVTDRTELDDQIAKTFKACGAVSEAEGEICHAQSGAHLRQLLGENHRYVFTLIHKFQTTEVLCDRPDVIVLTDEAHRSQYDTLALNMRTALPRALFLAFTGTPLIAGEERTREVFGDYVSIYDFQQSVEDGATVPLFYENRTPELRLENPNLNDDIYALIEAAELDEEQERRLERELGRQYHLLTRDNRLETVAKDIVKHFLGRGFQGKAMVVSIDKATAFRMYDKVRKHWEAECKRVEKELDRLTRYGAKSDPDQVKELQRRLDLIQSTDMALIVSPGQNEIAQMKEHGLDIIPHRKRMNEEELDEEFKNPTNRLRLVFVCAMWLTGFDAPSCSTIYLDKPMRNHSLMQTIARANRVFPGKQSGLIVDYANVFTSLEKALAIYGAGKGGAMPVRDKQKLVEELRQAVTGAAAFCAEQGVSIEAIEAVPSGNFDRVKRIGEAVEALITPDPLRKGFLAQEHLVRTLFQAVKPDPVVTEFAPRVSCLSTIADSIRERTGEGRADISAILSDVNHLLDESIASDGFVIKESKEGYGRIDLTKIDFAALAKRFGKSKTKNIELEQLKAAIRAQLDRMVRLNKTRADYLVKFEELIESYNTGSRNIEELFKELLNLSRALSEEQQRHVREHLSEEELVVFDILTRPAPELSSEERDEVKKIARELLQKLKELLVLDWRQRSSARSQVKLAIEDLLDRGLPRAYSPDLYRQKCSAVFEHFYEAYTDRGESLYGNVS
ncbi:type I restriction endonuclease subunit R [Candidatus Manganitrophus noduliformans]|uniref:Type I restriction enzyme endonuclease subunit n=1 Tax=Candidatus Manganitrophus noduliformans TaxID=2606439 RepID=A0A7X6DTZ3_9BACT|nr:type I restriction endonuclease subunit R [Candidatus Manganitrophus noduliformans]NKE73304.1 type I restriction endonuclease subunit R [Candidatus Manganitrophus noduliformans]